MDAFRASPRRQRNRFPVNSLDNSHREDSSRFVHLDPDSIRQIERLARDFGDASRYRARLSREKARSNGSLIASSRHHSDTL